MSRFYISALLEFEPLECELRLDDAGGLDPGPEHVLLRGHVVRAADAVEGVEIVGGAVVELQGHNSGESWQTKFKYHRLFHANMKTVVSV